MLELTKDDLVEVYVSKHEWGTSVPARLWGTHMARVVKPFLLVDRTCLVRFPCGATLYLTERDVKRPPILDILASL
jgi:hypothetical protein